MGGSTFNFVVDDQVVEGISSDIMNITLGRT